jgi:hypothetical protein
VFEVENSDAEPKIKHLEVLVSHREQKIKHFQEVRLDHKLVVLL